MRNFFNLAGIALLAMAALAACGDDGDGDKSLKLTGGTRKEQTVYADQVQKAGGINFTATADWTATVSAVATKAAADEVDWLTLSAYSGGAGEYSLTMTLEPNLTGRDRKAQIRIVCGESVITIVVEQKGTKEDGTLPDGGNTQGRRISRIRQDNYFLNGSKVEFDGTETYDFAYDADGRVTRIVQTEVDETSGIPGVSSITTVNTVAITYGDKSVAYEISSTENGVASPYKSTGSIVLDQKGRAVSGVCKDYDFKDHVYEFKSSYSLHYDAESRLVRALIHEEEETAGTDEERLTWENGNPVQVWWGSPQPGADIIDKARYGSVANNANLDLNWMLALDTEGFAFAAGDPAQIFAALGYVGVRSAMMAETVSESEYIGRNVYKYVYNTDSEGLPVSVTRTVTNESYHPELYLDRKFEITYAQ